MSNNFDWKFYINYYKDLKDNGIDNEEKAYEHWLRNGKNEKRYINNEFDWLFYINYNKDLEKIEVNNEEKANQHWINFGIFEERLCKRNNLFNWIFYTNFYTDLKNSKLDSEEKAYKHWINNGLDEKRICNDTLLCTQYLFEQENIDLNYPYNGYSNITDYIEKYAPHGKVFIEKNNYLDIDLYFYKKGNNLELNNKDDLLSHFHKNYNGLIYHPKQLLNIYPDIKILKRNKNIIVKHNDIEYFLNNFLEKYVYNKDFNYFSNLLIKNIEDKLTSSSLLLIVFIGNLNIGLTLINKIIEYLKIQKCNVAFCFNSDDICNKLSDVINTNFTNYSIYVSNEFGNDIIPSLLMYNDIIKKYIFKHIIKLQTKSNSKYFNELTNYLLSKKKKNLINSKSVDSNCINHENYYIKIINDQFNSELNDQYSNYIDCNKSFVTGTIFYTKSIIFNKVLNFIINNNFKPFLFNNMYDDNRTFFENSSIHFLERLFGVIK